MFRIIYPNRWLFWCISFLVFIFIILYGMVERFSVEQDIAINENELVYSIRLQRQLDQVENDVSGWKTYRNDKFGFEFKYPTNLIYQQPDGSNINFNTDGGVDRISINIIPATPKTEECNAGDDTSKDSCEIITFKDQRTKLYYSSHCYEGCGSWKIYVFYRNSFRFWITLRLSDYQDLEVAEAKRQEKGDNNLRILNESFNTLKFFEPSGR